MISFAICIKKKKKMKVWVTIICLLICNSLLAADYAKYHESCNSALIEKINGNTKRAIEYYEKAFSENHPFVDDLQELYKCYIAVNDKENAYRTLERMVISGFRLEEKSYLCLPTKPALEKIDNTDFIEDTTLLARLKVNYNDLKTRSIKNFDKESVKYIQSISTNDRFVGYMRTLADSSGESLISEIGFNANAEMFLNLIKSNLIDESIPFDIYGSYFYISLAHIALSVSKKDDVNTLFDYLKRQVIIGNLHPNQYAIYFDQNYVRVLGHTGSYYGAHYSSSWNEETSKMCVQIMPVEDPIKLDKRRASLFLPPLWVMEKLKGIVLPNNYKAE